MNSNLTYEMSSANLIEALPFEMDAHGNFSLNVLEFALPVEGESVETIRDFDGERVASVRANDLPMRVFESEAMVCRR